MATLLSNVVANLAEGIHKIKYKDCNCFLEYESVRNNLIKYKCLSCNKVYSNKLDKKLKDRFRTHLSILIMISINLFYCQGNVFSLWCMDDWEKFNEKTLPEIEEFYIKLNMEDITDADYMHAKRIYNNFEIKNFGQYHDVY